MIKFLKHASSYHWICLWKLTDPTAATINCCVLAVWVLGLHVNFIQKTTQLYIAYTRWPRIHMQSNQCSYFWFKMSDPYLKLYIYSQNVSCYNVNANHIEFLLNVRTWILIVQNRGRDGTLDFGWDAAFYTRAWDGQNSGAKKVWMLPRKLRCYDNVAC